MVGKLCERVDCSREGFDGKDIEVLFFQRCDKASPDSSGFVSFYRQFLPQSFSSNLHLQLTELPPDDPLAGFPPLLKVVRGWLGNSSDIFLDMFCITVLL